MNNKILLPVVAIALTASAAWAKESASPTRDPSNAKLPAPCEKGARAALNGARSASGNDDDTFANDLVFDKVIVNETGEIPPADGEQNIRLTAYFKPKKNTESAQGIVKVKVTRGGCLIEELIFTKN